MIRAIELIEIIHIDICGPFRVPTHRSIFYFISFINDYSGYEYLYLMKHKYETLQKIKKYKSEVWKEYKRYNITLLNIVRSILVCV